MAGNPNEGALSPKQLQVNEYYRIRISDEARPGWYKLILFQYMGSDGGEDFPLRFRYVQTNQTIRYKEAGSPGISNAVMREDATGPTFIYPVDETLRNLALRQIPSKTFYRPGGEPFDPTSYPHFADNNTHNIAQNVYDGVKRETGSYKQLTGDEIYKQNYGSGRKSRKRKTRKSKKRARKTRRRY